MASKRYPINIQLVGVLHKDKSQFYKTSVFWSDESDDVIYRSFQEFKKMHKQLKKAFPPANRLRNSDRIIPRFRDRRIKQRSGRKTLAKSLVPLKFFQKYCNALLRCDQRVCQSKDLIQFLTPKDQDLQPEFARNGIMIMPSEDERRSEGVDGNTGDVTHPFITETYKCVAPYETTDTKKKPFKVARGDKLDVVIKDKGGWWLVETEDKRIAWFPAPYLQRIDDNGDDDDDGDDGDEEIGALYTAVKSFNATKIDEVTVTMGAVVEVLKKSENGWWLVRSSGKVGYIPTMILEPYRYPHICMASQQVQHTPPSFLVPSLNLEQQSHLSHSQGNLLQHLPIRSLSPHPIQPDSKQRSRSLGLLPEQPPAQPSANNTSAASYVSTTPTTSSHSPLPTITVEMDGEVKQHSGSLAGDSDDSFVSDSTDFSFSDDLSFSSLNLSSSPNNEQLHLSRTPPPGSSNTLSPTNDLKGRLASSVSDPALYNAPRSPKVPPRPGAQEILSRCTSVTRKNVARDTTEIISC